MIPRINLLIATIWVVLFLVGCSNGIAPPVGPATSQPSHQPTDLTSQVAPQVQSAGHYLWGYYNVFVDPASPKFEIIPMRQAEGHWNVLKWLEQGPCTDCFKIVNVEPSGTGTLLIQINIKHPFPSANLTGFDVRGIAMFNGTHAFPEADLVTSDLTLDQGEIVNADGYTTLYKPDTAGSGPGGFQGYSKGKFGTPTYPTSTLNPYKRFISSDPSNTRNAFFAGHNIAVEYEVHMPGMPFVFGYAVDANWAPPTEKPVTDPMTQFPPEANCQEPWGIDYVVTPIGPGLHNFGGSAYLTVNVYDWQGKDTYAEPVIECPELFDGIVTAPWQLDEPDHSVYRAVIENTKHAPAGTYKCLIKVVDDENAGSPEWLDLTAYQIAAVEVGEFVQVPPVAKAVADPNPQNVCETVDFDDDGSYDPDGGSIETYEWDWDNDGTFDEEGNHVSHTWDVPGVYEVQYRVTDDDGQSGILDTPLSITIENVLPVASATVAHIPPTSPITVKTDLQFDGTASVDGDCAGSTITKWEWDWENDGTFDAEGSVQTHTYGAIGHCDVQLRVTDDEGATDLLDEPLQIDVVDFGWAITFGTINGQAQVNALAGDADGNIYAAGSCWYGADFDPGPGISESSKKGIFIVSYTQSGDYRWSHSWTTAGAPDEGDGIAVDDSGNVYMTGWFLDAHDFDPGPGEDIHTPDGASDVYLLKFDTDGNYIWGRHWGHAGWDRGEDVSVGENGNVYVSGEFVGSVDFDPSMSESYWLTGLGHQECFVSAFDSTGDFLWANGWGGNDTDPLYDYAYGVGADQLGNVCVTGQFSGTADFDPGSGTTNLTSNGTIDGYLVSYDATDGALIWAHAFSGPDNYERGSDVEMDPSGYVYVAGNLDGTVDFDFGAGVENRAATGWVDAFLAKYDWDGAFQWVYSWGCTSSYTYGRDVTLTPDGHVAIDGSFFGSIDFDPGAGHSDWTANGGSDVFVCYFSQGGTFGWANAWGGSENENKYSWAVASDPSGNIFAGGEFKGTVDFDPSAGVDEHTPPGDYEGAFISKFLPSGSW